MHLVYSLPIPNVTSLVDADGAEGLADADPEHAAWAPPPCVVVVASDWKRSEERIRWTVVVVDDVILDDGWMDGRGGG